MNLIHEQTILAGVRVLYRNALKRKNIMAPIGLSTEAMLQYCIEWDAPVRETIYDWNTDSASSKKLTCKTYEFMLEVSQRAAVIYEEGIKAIRETM